MPQAADEKSVQAPYMSNVYTLSKSCPREIDVGGVCYALNLSFDRVLAAFELLCSDEYTDEDTFDILFDWFVVKPSPKDTHTRAKVVDEIFDRLINFDKSSKSDEPETISFAQDAPYIYAAFRQAYGIDLFKEQGKLQWWEFMALLSAIPSDTRLCDIIDIRTRKIPAYTGKNQEQIDSLLKLKSKFAITKPVNATQAQDGWEKLFKILEQKAEER